MKAAETYLARISLVTWLVVAGILFNAAFPREITPALLAFLALAVFVQASLFTAPVALIGYVGSKLNPGSSVVTATEILQTLVSLGTIGFMLANVKLYDLYGFHTNYFVYNLIATPGGIEAMGVTQSTWLTLAVISAVCPPAYYLLMRRLRIKRPVSSRASPGKFALVFTVSLLSQSLIYAYADYSGETSVLGTADRIVWYVPITAKSLFTRLGLPRPDRSEIDIDSGSGKLNYPNLADLAPATSPAVLPYNIVWLVAESWRADSLSPQVMPNTYAFAEKNLWFQEHYSGGNGTRMGMFTQFYGIYGSYWFDMLQTRTPPVLMNYLQQQDYQFKAFTSSAFTYPEFDKTIFSALPQESLVAYSEGYGWQRDQKNTTDLINFIESTSEPFFSFMFFESSHANYYFPDEDIIADDYLEDFNYLTTDISEDIEQIHNRYRNATHHLDRQFARIFASLERNGLMDNTIVIITGDHGEEFMENGRWGHNSTFSQQQIRVPLVLHIPGSAPQQIRQMTSHLDLPATLLNALGAGFPAGQFSFGANLLDPTFQRDYTVVSDWHGNTLVTPEIKITFSLKGAAKYAGITDLNDHLVELEGSDYHYRDQLADFARTQNRFYD